MRDTSLHFRFEIPVASYLKSYCGFLCYSEKEFPGKDPLRPDRLLQWELVSLKLYLLQNLTKRLASRSEWEQPLKAGLNVMNNMIDTPLVSLLSSSCSFPTYKE